MLILIIVPRADLQSLNQHFYLLLFSFFFFSRFHIRLAAEVGADAGGVPSEAVETVSTCENKSDHRTLSTTDVSPATEEEEVDSGTCTRFISRLSTLSSPPPRLPPCAVVRRRFVTHNLTSPSGNT